MNLGGLLEGFQSLQWNQPAKIYRYKPVHLGMSRRWTDVTWSRQALRKKDTITHRIHGTDIFAYIYHKKINQIYCKYTNPMDLSWVIFYMFLNVSCSWFMMIDAFSCHELIESICTKKSQKSLASEHGSFLRNQQQTQNQFNAWTLWPCWNVAMWDSIYTDIYIYIHIYIIIDIRIIPTINEWHKPPGKFNCHFEPLDTCTPSFVAKNHYPSCYPVQHSLNEFASTRWHHHE